MSKVNATYGRTQSPEVIRTAGRVGVAEGSGMEVAIGVLVNVALGKGDGVDVAGDGILDAQAATTKIRKRKFTTGFRFRIRFTSGPEDIFD